MPAVGCYWVVGILENGLFRFKDWSRDCQNWSSVGTGREEPGYSGPCHETYQGTVLACRED